MYSLPMMLASARLSGRQKTLFGVFIASLGFALQATQVESSASALASALYAVGLVPALAATNSRQMTVSVTSVAMLSFAAITAGRAHLHPDVSGLALIATWGTITAIAVVLTAVFRLKSRVSTLANELEKERRRSQALFDLSPVALWEQDYTEIVKFVRELNDAGVTNVTEHAARNPEFVSAAAKLIRTHAVNRAALDMLGAEKEEELLGCLQRFLPDDTSPFINVMQALLDGKRCYEGTAQMRGPRGRVCTAYIAIRFRSSECSPGRVIVGMVDVTERQQMISDLRDANLRLESARRFSEMGVLASTIAHDLSQPVTGVTVNAQTALRWLSTKGEVESAVRSMELVLRDARRASEILAVTRSRMSSRPAISTAPVNINCIVEDVVQLMWEELASSGARLEVQPDTKALEVAGPPVELQQILVNLLSNAVHAVREISGKTKRIIVKTQALPSGDVSVTVSDNGPGISEDIADQLFTPFVTTKKDGMGMGLSIAKGAIERRGGKISAHNKPAGGAVFEFTLPMYLTASAQACTGAVS